MRSLEEDLLSPSAVVAAVDVLSGTGRSDNFDGWLSSCHGLLYNLSLIVPSALFVAFLASQARKSLTKLAYGRSYIIISYYGLLWGVSLFNLIWCIFQYWECSAGRELRWNLLTLVTKSGLLFLEISLVAFLLQGNQPSGLDALTRTFFISGIIISVDIIIKSIYVFVMGIPLFIDNGNSGSRVKWIILTFHKLLLAAVYGILLFIHHSKWRERLPARPMFYKYVLCMFLLNAVVLFSCMLLANNVSFGAWLYDLGAVCYHSLYLPLLYITFLADFFQEEDLSLENAYYSEMRDAGFLDADWD